MTSTVWLLWDERDYYTPALMGVYATEAAARTGWDEAVRADAERDIARIEASSDRLRIPAGHLLSRAIGRQPSKAEWLADRLDRVRRDLDRTLARGIDGHDFSIEERTVEG